MSEDVRKNRMIPDYTLINSTITNIQLENTIEMRNGERSKYNYINLMAAQ